MVYPGTEAFRWAKDSDYLTTQDYSRWLTKEGLHNCIVSTPDLSSEDLVDFCDYARRSFYLRPFYVLSKMAQMVSHPYEAKRILKSFMTFRRHVLKNSLRR
jgi:hypothetical protein